MFVSGLRLCLDLKKKKKKKKKLPEDGEYYFMGTIIIFSHDLILGL
jgi:hypothetical protein